MNSKTTRLIIILKARVKKLRAPLSVRLKSTGLLKAVYNKNSPCLLRGQIRVGETLYQISRYLEKSKKVVIFN
jgi:hypothetical protein